MTQAKLAPEGKLGRERPGRYPLVKGSVSRGLSAFLFYAFVSLTALAVFVPLTPAMPRQGIDPSYAYAINQAVARHLSFGRQIVFTYGPYGSVVSRMYDPAIDLRMMWASLIFGMSYIAATLYLARGRHRFLVVILLLFLATFGPGELLLLSYPFLLVLCVLKHLLSHGEQDGSPLGWRTLLAIVVMWATLGTLPVIKGSLVLSYAAAVTLPPALLVYRSRFKHALLLFLTPIAASLGLWVLAGQSLADIPGFMRGTSWLISGFAGAMSTPWSVLPAALGNGLVLFYLAVAGVSLLSVARSKQLNISLKVILCLLLGVALFVPFKHGFLAVSGVSSAFASLAVCLLILQLLLTDRYLQWAVSMVILATAATSVIRDPVLIKEVHDRFGVGASWSGGAKRPDILVFCIDHALPAYGRSTYKRTLSTYSEAWTGFSSRLTHGHDGLNSRYVDAVQTIRNDYPLPALRGTVDFYEYDQSVLLASGDAWNPRPVIQSYSVYTPELARLDEAHLRGPDAPDWIVFELETIDGRLPSLDDGVSWPAFLDNYKFVSYNSRFVLMQKNPVIRPSSHFVNISSETYQAGAKVLLPRTDGLLFAEVDLKPTMAGRVLTALLNPPQLKIVLGLEDGETRTFRVVSNMMKTDFLLSPLVGDTKDFANLIAQKQPIQDAASVRTISIAPSYGGSTYWSGTYQLTLKKYLGD